MVAIPRLMRDGVEEKSCKEEESNKFQTYSRSTLSSLTCSLKLLHPPQLVHRVVQPSDLVVVEEEKSEAGQMI